MLRNKGYQAKWIFRQRIQKMPKVQKPKLVYMSPGFVHGKSFNVFSGFGIVTMVLFAFMYYWNWRGRNE